MKKHSHGLLLVVVAALLSGCSTVVNSHRQKEDMMTSYLTGDNQTVSKELDYKLREPTAFNSSVVNSVDELMWRLESGGFNFVNGNYAASIDQFKIAEKLISDYDERARVSARDVGSEGAMLMTNLNSLPYRGFCRDRIALCVYKSLAYLGSGNEDAFRAQVKRLRDEQKKVQEDYAEFFEQEKAEMKAAAEKNAKEAEALNSVTNQEEFVENVNNAEFSAGIQDVKKIANKGYGNFLNPAALFFSGLASIRDGNYENARIDFKRIYEAMPDNPLAKRYYASVLEKAGREIPSELKGVAPFDFPLDRDCVYVVVANGRGAAFKQIALHFPVATAWPMCEFYPSPFDGFTVQADNQTHAANILADMDGIIAQEFNERLPGMITRIVLSTAIKDGAYYGGLAAVWNSNMDPIAKCITWCSIAIGGAAYRAAMNTADTRTWELLPKEFHLAQMPMPKKRELSVRLNGAKSVTRTVVIPEDCRSAIVFVNAPSADNVTMNVLPIKSK